MANLITIARFPLLILIILLLSASSALGRLISVGLMIILIAMDMVDGMVARKRNEVSLLGSVLDIMADRSVELVLWVVYAHLGLIPLAIPIICVLRGTIVDALRSVHIGAGNTPFKGMRSKLGKWLVGSPYMRTPYGVVKLLAFAGLALTHALSAYHSAGQVSGKTVQQLGLVSNVVSWVAVAFCLARGLPVIVEALPLLAAPTRPEPED